MIWYANDRDLGKAANVCITGGFHMQLNLNESQMYFSPKDRRHVRNRFLCSQKPYREMRRKWFSIGVRSPRLPIGGVHAS